MGKLTLELDSEDYKMENENMIVVNVSDDTGEEHLKQCMFDDNNKFGAIHFASGYKEGVKLNKSIRLRFYDIESINKIRGFLDFIENGFNGKTE